MPYVGYAGSVMNVGPRLHMDISDKELPEPVTLVIEVTLPTPTFLFYYMIIHSSVLMHAFIHSFVSSIHPYIHPIHPSIAYAIAASQCFASCHEAVVVSFDMSGV